jgi:hypothetical protein
MPDNDRGAAAGTGPADAFDATDGMTVDDLVWFTFGRFTEGDRRTMEHVAAAASSIFGGMADDLARVPEPLRADEHQARTWVEFVVTLAQMLRAHGESRLANRLFSPVDNPLDAWIDALAQAQRLRADGCFAESDEVLAAALDGLRAAQGTAVDELLAKALGAAAANAFDLGRLDDALRLTDEALRECERTGDADGVATYSSNLATIHALDETGESAVKSAAESPGHSGSTTTDASTRRWLRSSRPPTSSTRRIRPRLSPSTAPRCAACSACCASVAASWQRHEPTPRPPPTSAIGTATEPPSPSTKRTSPSSSAPSAR